MFSPIVVMEAIAFIVIAYVFFVLAVPLRVRRRWVSRLEAESDEEFIDRVAASDRLDYLFEVVRCPDEESESVWVEAVAGETCIARVEVSGAGPEVAERQVREEARRSVARMIRKETGHGKGES